MPSLLRKADQSGLPLLTARLILGIMFVYTGANKVHDPVAFLKLLREYEALPDSAYIVSNTIAVALPWVEIACGLFLLAGVLLRGSGLVLLLMLTGFTFLIANRGWQIHLTQGIALCAVQFDCGCGTGKQFVCRKVPENLALWLLAWIPLLSKSRRFCLQSAFGSSGAPRAVPEPPAA